MKNFDKKGVMWGDLKSVAMVILILLVLWWILFGSVTPLFASLNACEKKWGECVNTPCYLDADTNQAPVASGNGVCKREYGEDYICCTSDTIKAKVQAKIDAAEVFKQKIYLNVTGKFKAYFNNDVIELVTGKKYTFAASIPQNFSEHHCTIRAIHASGPQKDQLVQIAGHKSDGTFMENANINKLVACTAVSLQNLVFSEEHLDDEIIIEVLVYNESVTEKNQRSFQNVQESAKFKLNIFEPISVNGLPSGNPGWAKSKDFTVSCKEITCNVVSYFIPGAATEESKKLTCQAGSAAMLEDVQTTRSKNKEFIDGRATFVVDENNPLKLLPQNGSILQLDSHLCFEINTSKLNDQGIVESEMQRVLSPGPLRFDAVPPTVTGLDGLNIECEDFHNGIEGSGCHSYQYKFIDVISENEVTDWDQFLKEALTAAQSRILERKMCTGAGYYSSTTDQMISTRASLGREVLVASVCIKATDAAGNPGEEEIFLFTNWEFIQQKAKEIGFEALLQSLGLIPKN